MRLDLNGPAGQVQGTADGNGAQLVTPADSPYAAAVDRGNVYIVAAQATVATQSTLSATTPALSITNRPNSGKTIKLWYAGCGSLVSATAAAAIFLALGGYSATPVTESTPSTTVFNAKTGAKGNPEGVGVSVISTLPAAPVAVAILGAQSSAAITVDIVGFHVGRWFDGALWIQEGFNLTIQTSTVSTLFCDYIFEVVDA